MLAATIGMPYFLLSTTSPLVQVWFGRALVLNAPSIGISTPLMNADSGDIRKTIRAPATTPCTFCVKL
jgi:hypothetical protein